MPIKSIQNVFHLVLLFRVIVPRFGVAVTVPRDLRSSRGQAEGISDGGDAPESHKHKQGDQLEAQFEY